MSGAAGPGSRGSRQRDDTPPVMDPTDTTAPQPPADEVDWFGVEPYRNVAIRREHWATMLTGMLDSAFGLTDEEQLGVMAAVNHLLEFLDIPGRGDPVDVPVQLALEAQTGLYSARLGSGAPRFPRHSSDGGYVLPVNTWRVAIQRLFQVAYPDIDPLETILMAKVINDLLAAIGLPDRAAVFTPDHVWRSLADS